MRFETVKLHGAIDEGKQGVIATDADPGARTKARAPLADDDVAGNNRFAAKFFHAQPLLAETLSRPLRTLP